MICSALRYDLMGIVPRGESPWGWAPTIHFGMAADAINVSETTYLTVVRYYLANLGTTVESQVRSSVAPQIFCQFCLSCRNLPKSLSFLLAPRCVPHSLPSSPLSKSSKGDRKAPLSLVAA